VFKSPLSFNKFIYAFASWWAVWASLQVLVITNFGYGLKEAVLDSVLTNAQLVGACWMVSTMLKYYLPRKERYLYMLCLSAGLAGLTLLITKWLLVALLDGEPLYLAFFSQSLLIRFVISFLLIFCMAILSVLWYTLEDEKENQKRTADAERLTKEAELFTLRQQLQPHFLFNSLNSISALVGNQPEQARSMIQQLSDFLRGSLKKEEQQWSGLSEEMQYLQLYLEIEKVRFGHRLSTVIDIDPPCLAMKLPAMLLQPIVENAIKFGLYDTTDAVTISIVGKNRGEYLEIVVENPFDPQTAYPKQGTGFGLSSVRRRLYLLYARNDLLQNKSEGNLFTTIVKIPQTA
jgi:two-component system, LytTR family, sensor kinase